MTETAAFARLLPRIEAALDAALPLESSLAPTLVQAMRYSARSGGKRIRPLLTCAVCESLTGDVLPALVPAVAVELVACERQVGPRVAGVHLEGQLVAVEGATPVAELVGLEALVHQMVRGAPLIVAGVHHLFERHGLVARGRPRHPGERLTREHARGGEQQEREPASESGAHA